MAKEQVSSKTPYPSKFIEIDGAKIHYLEAGTGNPILFLHSIPLSSYSWRNVIPFLAPLGRCIAPDLIGFGRSDKPNISYSIQDHIKYIEKFIEALKLTKLTLIMHGWGSIIGFHYAMHHEKNCRALVFYEAFLRFDTDEEMSLPLQEQINDLKATDFDTMNDGVSFVDHVLPQQIMRELSAEEMDNYRLPFTKKGSTQPLLQYIKELPQAVGRKETDNLILEYSEKLTRSKLPKLILYTVPGFVTTIDAIMRAKENLPKLEIVELGEEYHLAQETYPKLMGETISVWLQGLEV